MLTVAEAAEIADRDPETIRKACQRGSLRAKRVGATAYRGAWIILREDLEAWMAGVVLKEQRRDGAGRFRGPVSA